MLITEADVAEAMRDWVAAAQNRDFARVWAMESGGIGFGYRTLSARGMGSTTRDDYVKRMNAFFASFVSYDVKLETVETAVQGEIGMAWGTYTENFQVTGSAPERVRVRFSQVMSKGESGWRVIMFHRDIQPFDTSGAYPRSLTTA